MTRRTLWLAGCLLIGPLLAGSEALSQDKLTAFLSDDAKTLSYASCDGEESPECLVHALDCGDDPSFGNGLGLTLIGQGGNAPNIRKLATALIDKPLGESLVVFTIGGRAVDLTVHATMVSSNEMNADWDLSIHFMDDDRFFDALTKETASSVGADIAGHAIRLGYDKASADALMRFKTACER